MLKKAKTRSRVMAFVMALLMVASLLPSDLLGGAFVAKAADKVYVLDASADLQAAAQGSLTDGGTIKAGTDDYFTVYTSAKMKIDSSEKTFDDGYAATQRINPGGKSDVTVPKNAIAFKTGAAAEVKIWWVSGGDGRSMAVTDAAGTVIAGTDVADSVKNTLYISKLNVEEDGNYFVAAPEGSNYIFKVEVTEAAAGPVVNEYILDASADLQAAAQGSLTDGGTIKAGTDEFFTLYTSAKMKIDGSDKTFDDGYTATQRINPGGKSDLTVPKNAIAFKTEGTATVKIWWVSGGDGRSMAVTDAAGTVVKGTDVADSVKNTLYISTLEVAEPGNYFVAAPEGSNYIFKVQVTDTIAPEPVVNDYILDASADLEEAAQGSLTDGGTIKAGTDEFFTLYTSAKMKIDGSDKTFDDGYTATQRINPGGKSDLTVPKNAIAFKTEGTATVKIWWVSGGDGRSMAVTDAAGTVVKGTDVADSVKNTLYISTLEVAEPGNYFVAAPEGSNYIFKVQVTDVVGGAVEKPRKAWADVAAPKLGTPALKDGNNGTIVIPYEMVIGDDGADEVLITVKDSEGNELQTLKSLIEGASGSKEYSPSASGTYTFSIAAVREGEENKTGTDVTFDFVLPLAKPTITSATSAGAGSVVVKWTSVDEAEKYQVLCDGDVKATVEGNEYKVTGLEVGKTYSFTVKAVRGEDVGDASAAKEAVATAEAQREWGFVAYGPSSTTDTSKNGYVGDINLDGKVTVFSEGGKGKIQPAAPDGVAFYYTPIPTEYNFTLKATLLVDKWKENGGQSGFGIMATDRLGEHGNTGNFYNNSISAVASKIEYRWDPVAKELVTADGVKYSMKNGLGVMTKTGLTPDTLENPTAAWKTTLETLETTAAEKGLEAGTYNIYANETSGTVTAITELTEVTLEIQKNNTGYFVSYYAEDGTLLKKVKYYGADALNQLDSEYVYVGFFAARDARVTATDIELTTILATEDAPAEERPITKIEPTFTVGSGDIANSDKYNFIFTSNVDGTVDIKLGDKVIASGLVLEGKGRIDQLVDLPTDKNKFEVVFTPDADQEMEEYTALANTDKITVNKTVTISDRFDEHNNIYVSPTATSKGYGSRTNPVDIYTAVKYVKPGQTIVIMEGTYLLDKSVRIEKGIDGTEDAPIRMVADPEAKTRPVFDFQTKVPGVVHLGNYWYFNGFDVTRSVNMEEGFQVAGSNNTLDSINTYFNGNAGIQISRNASVDISIEYWPANNLILNCTSYGNADASFADADGFAAKLTIGEGNVFDGCVAYNNADDGWDLFAKPETGPIGKVIIKNSVAYANGYKADGTLYSDDVNGNGFKMGGNSITGKHELINCYAFYNYKKGIDSNSCPDIIVENCITYNNEGYNVAFYTNDAKNTDFSATGIISFKDSTIKSGLSTAEQFKVKGTQDPDKYLGATNFYWDGAKSANAGGTEATAEWFKSLTFTGITRNEDGTINMNGFLELTALAPANIGAVPGGTASTVVVLAADTIASKGDMSNAYIAWLVLIGAAFVAAGFFAKKKFA